ncbi:hypothetical protein [Oenococcus kitaharae]|nr:hypothetical protein [Oenococcus kitaharae]
MKLFIASLLFATVWVYGNTATHAQANELKTGVQLVITRGSPIPVQGTVPPPKLIKTPYYVIAPGSDNSFKLSDAHDNPLLPRQRIVLPDTGEISQCIVINFAFTAIAVTSVIIYKNFKRTEKKEN